MRKAVFFTILTLTVFGLAAEPPAEKTLFVYDEVNDQSKPYIGHFREAFVAEGIPFEEATASELKTKDLSPYDTIVLHGMVMAFNTKSPIRDWLKTGPDLSGKRIHLFVTANRWFLDKLFGDLTKLLNKDKADVVDAVSMATKKTTDAEEADAVRVFVARMR